MKAESHHQKLRTVFTDVNLGRRLLAHMWRHFKEDRCFAEAASLGYTSLLSLVPLLAVVFGFASIFPVFNDWSDQLKAFVYSNMVPAAGTQLAENLDQFLGSVNKLTITGTFFLILTALLLMMRIEKSFNLIWRVPRPRPFMSKLVIYWTVLTAGPLALGAAAALSAQPFLDYVPGGVVDTGLLRNAGIFLLTWIAFGLMFLLVPNCKVPFSYAALGAFVSTVLFTVAKSAFVVYVGRASYSVIYGALASVPIFLFWLYIVWAVILLGASLAASLTTFSARGTDWEWPAAWEFLLVFRLLGHFHRAQLVGEVLDLDDLLEREPGIPSSRLQDLLRNLVDQNLITQNQEGAWLLKRDLAHYSLRDLYMAGDYHLPIGKSVGVPTSSPWDAAFLELLNARGMDLDVPLAQLFEPGDVAEAMDEEEPL